MIIKSKAGTEIAKNGYTVIDELNQIPMIKTNYLQLEYNHINPIIIGSKAFEYKDVFVNVVEDTETSGDTAFKEYNAIHEFAWILSGMRKHDSYTGYLSLEQYLTMVLEGTDFTYQVEGGHQYYALQFDNLGDGESHLDMFFKMLNRWNTEFELRGKKVYITHQRGRLRDKHVGRYKMNIIDTIINSDITDGATAVWGYFGKKDEENPENSTYREFYWQIDELVEQYGIRYAKPYSNENITQEETMIEYLNNIILDSWKISTEVDIADIADEVAHTGDEYVAVDERLGITLNTRIQKLESVYDADDKLLYQTATLGTVSFASASSGSSNQLQEVIEKVKKDYNDRITDLKQEFDNRFNDEVTQVEKDFTELVNGVRQEIQADKEAFQLQYEADKEALSGEIQDSYDNAVTEANRIVEAKETDFKNYADGIGSAANGRVDDLYEGFGDLSSEFENLEIGGRNLLLGTTNEEAEFSFEGWNDNDNQFNVSTSGVREISKGGTFTVSVDITEHVIGKNRVGVIIFLRKNGSLVSQHFSYSSFVNPLKTGKVVYTVRLPESDIDNVAVNLRHDAVNASLSEGKFANLKFEKGNKPTDWTPAPEDLMKYTDIIARPDGFLIGSFEMGGDKIAQAIVGKAGAIDLIADNVNFTGNVNVANQIKAYSLEAVYADIAKLRTNVLTANSVSATALKVDTALINKLNTNSILTNYLIADTAMINNIKSKSLEAVYADISELRTRMLVADVITANMVKFDTALIEKFTSSTAFINSLTAKSAFINNVKAIDIDFDRATARAGDTTTYLTITGNRITQRGQFRRQWRNTWYDYDVGTILREGYLKFADYNRNREISISAFGISTFLDGSGNDAGFAGSSGTISWWDKTYGNADGITMSSHVGVAALRSFMNRVVLEADSTVDLYSNSSTIYLNPHTQTYGGTNRFMFTIGPSPSNESHIVGYQMYGANTSDIGFGVGLRFDKTRAAPKIRVVNQYYATSSSTTFEVGNVETEIVKPRPGQERLDIYTENAMNLYYTASGDFGVRSGYVYNKTYSNAPNMFISQGRVIGRSTSASKYKLAIEKQFENDKEQYDYSKRILGLDIKTWFDRGESEIYAEEIEKGERISKDEFTLERHAGLIAEDVYEVGLEEHVSYGAHGEVEGIEYDRLWIHLLPIIKKQQSEITELKSQINKIMEMIA